MSGALFADRLAALPAEMPRGDFVDHVKQLEREATAALAADAGLLTQPGRGLGVSRALAGLKDDVIRAAAARLGRVPGGLSVMAVGGYGRGELSPYSDVDLLMLTSRSRDPGIPAFISDLLRLLWDVGYNLGSSVREVRQAIGDAREDPHLLTALFTQRLIAGDRGPAEAMTAALRRLLPRVRLPFLRDAAAETRSVLRDLGGEVLVKEPDLKTNPGGLRSVHLILWLCYAFDGEADLLSLWRLFTPREHRRLVDAYDFVLSGRNLLHFRAGRREDVLRIEYQVPVAQAFGIRGDGREMATRLMRRYYQRSSDILMLLVQTVDRLTLEHLKPRRRRVGAEGLFVAASVLHVEPEAASAAATPLRALEALLQAARCRAEPSGSLIGLLARSAGGLSGVPAQTGASGGGNGRPAQSRELFLKLKEILSLPDSSMALNALQLSGFLHAWLTPLKGVRHTVVHNEFHTHTVDQHSIEAVRALESFPAAAAADPARYRLAAGLSDTYRDSLWVVKLALLLHDAGKAYAGDHAKNGAELARRFLKSLPTESLFKDMIVFLVENHLLLSNLARRGSIEEQSVIDHLAAEFILTPFPQESLELLYLLTCADVSATNPRAYSGYHAATMQALFLRASRVVAPGAAELKDPATRLEELLANLAGQSRAVQDFARTLGLRYCATNSVEEILDDHQGLRDLDAPAGAAVADAPAAGFRLRVTVFNDHLKVKVVARDRIGLFASLSGILLVNGADIVRADIHTFCDTAIDEFVVTGVHGYDILERRMEKELSAWIDDLRRSFETYLARPAELERLVTEIEVNMRKSGRRVPEAFHRPTEVAVSQSGERRLRIELACTDRPALLHDVARLLAAMGCDVRAAVIDTTGWYVMDRFEAEAREPIGPDAADRLQAAIRDAVT